MEIGLRFLLVPLVSLVWVSSQARESSFATLTEVNPRLTFTCKHEAMPTPTADADLLFKYARWLQKNNQLRRDEAVDAEVERLYRIASEYGHSRANINLQNGAMRAQFKLRGAEHLRMSQQLINYGVASGYYFVSIFLKQGVAGLHQDPDMALRYLRKAADEGSSQAQYEVGKKLQPISIAPAIALQMYRCAAEQGHGKAALALGVHLQDESKYRAALEAFQYGVAAGDETAAFFIEKGFRNPPISNSIYYLGQNNDADRAGRYEKIGRVLSNYSYANPRVSEINEIVPLPPAELPEWDGKLQWLEDRLANIPPPTPNEALVKQLADAKKLDPATGWPLPGSPAFSQADLFPQRSCTGQLCPTSGYWTNVEQLNARAMEAPVARYFEEGEMMPPVLMRRYQRRHWPFSDRVSDTEEAVTWKLV